MEAYEIHANETKLISDYCASVYLVEANAKKYIFKLYRNFDTEIAFQSANIMEYLSKNSFPAAQIISTKNGEPTVSVPFPDGNRIGILFDFIDGTMGYEFPFETYAEQLGETTAILHSLMEKYDKPLIRYGKEHYAGRYIHLMKAFNYAPAKIAALEDFAETLWQTVIKSTQGFCHGDLNPSNFIKSKNELILFDFDCAGMSYPVNDIFTICAMTESFADFKDIDRETPMKKLALLRPGYEKYRKLNQYDIPAMYAFIGLSCYWMGGQHDKYKTHLEGRKWVNESYFENNYRWLMKWKECCINYGF